jgi:hypothetical protein
LELKAMKEEATVRASLIRPAAAPQGRRSLLIGAGAVGAATLAVKVLPGTTPPAAALATAKAAADTAGGYQLTPHVLRYYETARA